MNNHDVTLVVGGTGKTGRRVVERLEHLGLPHRVGSRTAKPAFDWEDPKTCVPGAVETVQSFFTQAVDAGVKKLVLLSGRGEVEAEQAEKALQSCGVDWTILRCSFFNQNFSENFFLDSIVAGEVALPVRPVSEPFVDTEDIADVAVAALTDHRHSGQLYELTGPRALTFAEAIGEIAKFTGRDIRYLSVTAEDYRAALSQAVPDDVIELLLYLFGTVLDGRNTPVADGVQRALGRAPRDFSEYVRSTAANGVWAA
jgi:uncharacterized protein YbjT (DUF2867 family)